MLNTLGMVTLAGSCIWWAWQTEDAFSAVAAGDKHALKRHAQRLSAQLAELVGMVGAACGTSSCGRIMRYSSRPKLCCQNLVERVWDRPLSLVDCGLNTSLHPPLHLPVHRPTHPPIHPPTHPSQVRGELDALARKKVNTLVITDVHGRDILDGFVRDSVLDAREFAWESQLRFYWERGTVGGLRAGAAGRGLKGGREGRRAS